MSPFPGESGAQFAADALAKHLTGRRCNPGSESVVESASQKRSDENNKVKERETTRWATGHLQIDNERMQKREPGRRVGCCIQDCNPAGDRTGQEAT